jgi:uncharacterized membrane protein
MNKSFRFWLVLFSLVAFGLRLYNLTYHSLWFDEAISVHWARQSVPRILEVGLTLVEDRLPPLYYLLLKGWTALFGFSEFSLRSLSAFLGTLLVPVIAAIAAMLFNRRVAWLTALLVALNPFLIWYSQEARMYALAVLFGALAGWAWLQICKFADLQIPPITKSPSRFSLFIAHYSWLILFILFALAGLYTHLYTGFLLPALGLWLVISYPGRWRLWSWFALAGLIITLAFAPLALATWRFSGEATPGDPLTGLVQRTWWLLQAFTFWKAPLPSYLQTIIPTVIGLFVALAYLPFSKLPSQSSPFVIRHVSAREAAHSPIGYSPFRHSPRVRKGGCAQPDRVFAIQNPRLLVTLLLLTPFVIANLLLLRNHLAFYGERYFIAIAPWLLLLAAVGAGRVSAWANQRIGPGPNATVSFAIRYSPFAILLLLTLLPLPGLWTLAAAKEAWRQSTIYLAQQATPADGILIHPDWVRYPFQYYFRGPGQTYAVFSQVTDQTALDGPLQGVVDSHPVIWLIQSHLDGPDPERRVEQWLAARYPLVTEAYPPGISIKAYAPSYQLDRLPPQATPTNIEFANGLRLAGFETAPIVSATDDLFHPPSGWLHVTLYWTVVNPINQDAAPFVNLIGPAGIWGASLDRPNDALKLYPTSRWPAGQAGRLTYIRHDLDVNLNPATPPGRYQLVVGLSGQPPEQYPLAEVEVR